MTTAPSLSALHQPRAGPIPIGIVGWVDVANKKTNGIEIPGVTSFLASGSFKTPYPGLNDIPSDELPPIQTTYQTYHWMVMLWGAMLLLGRPGGWRA